MKFLLRRVPAILGYLAATAPALANFPNCQPPLAAPNPALAPDAGGHYAPDPALPYPGPHTVWRANGLAIERTLNGATETPFIVHGVNYEPTQIGGSASISPYNDLFYTTDTKLWQPLWARDLPALRAIGVNAIRTYSFWKFEPGFAAAPQNPAPTGVAAFWPQLDFTPIADPPADRQFCVPGQPGIYAFEHRTHRDFLDRLWNNGKNPIQAWIGISLPPQLVDPATPAADRAQYLQFYRYTARWLAKMYGNHPAVMGFVIGNELDTGATTRTKLFWQTLNDIGQIVKASAPDKLTLSAFRDTPDFAATVTDAPNHPTGPQLYNLDAWALNPYTNPAPQGNLFERYQHAVVQCRRADKTSCAKPLLFGEYGVPADTHVGDSNLSTGAYPLPWVAPNFVWHSNPPNARCLASNELGPPPGPGGKGPQAEAAANASIAAEMPADPNHIYDMPAQLTPFFNGVTAKTPLPAAAQADWIANFLRVAAQYQVEPSAPPSAHKFNSGGFVFEWRDEFWKSNDTPASRAHHTISGADQCAPGCPTNCNTGGANIVFPGGWADEEWFGLTSATPTNRNATDPVVAPNGQLTGAPDTLYPRAAVVALCRAFGGCGE